MSKKLFALLAGALLVASYALVACNKAEEPPPSVGAGSSALLHATRAYEATRRAPANSANSFLLILKKHLLSV
ncbi:MAG: hypothetical protein D8M53_12550 [Armatimonadetes bacterium]|nr:hypothetical protein [Armatimonadota bacterium]